MSRYVCMHVFIHVEAHVCGCVHMCTHDGYLLLISLYWDKVSCWTWKFPIWLLWVSLVSASWVLELWVGHHATGFYVSAGYLNSGGHTGEPTPWPCDILLFFWIFCKIEGNDSIIFSYLHLLFICLLVSLPIFLILSESVLIFNDSAIFILSFVYPCLNIFFFLF